MSDTLRRATLANAFVTQARSDWKVYNLLEQAEDVERCHALHYLQIACGKLAKAYRLRDTTSSVDERLKHDTGFESFVAAFVVMALKPNYRDRIEAHKSLAQASRKYARAIENLAPALDRMVSPENVEYPWEGGTDVRTPCNYLFNQVDFLNDAKGRTFLKMVKAAHDSCERTRV